MTYKVLAKETAMDVMNLVLRKSGVDVQPRVKSALEGQVVYTLYNNKSYRIDLVDFNTSPMATFHLRDRDVTYAEYFETKYNVVVKNKTQPLLRSRPSRRDLNRGDFRPIYLIPELCGMTGLSKKQRANLQLMKAVGEVTKPQKRLASIMRFRQMIFRTANVSFFFVLLFLFKPIFSILNYQSSSQLRCYLQFNCFE